MNKATSRSLTPVFACGLSSLTIYAAIQRLSESFLWTIPDVQRPIAPVLFLFVVAFVLHLVALAFAVRTSQRDARPLVALIVGFALTFRMMMLFSEPIQEIDIYRYIWDGAVRNAGVSPFEYAPRDVIATSAVAPLPEDLIRLAQLRDSSASLQQILERVHFGELPTVYPPVSQAVFSLASWFVPPDASLESRVLAMKAWLLLFDVGAMLCIVASLRFTGLHPGWAITYAWCPLVMKEFANSGHLDSIAVCLSSLAVLLAIRSFFPSTGISPRSRFGLAMTGSLLLALAVGAKLYPVILAPILAMTGVASTGKNGHVGHRSNLRMLHRVVSLTSAHLKNRFVPSRRRTPARSEPGRCCGSAGRIQSLLLALDDERFHLPEPCRERHTRRTAERESTEALVCFRTQCMERTAGVIGQHQLRNRARSGTVYDREIHDRHAVYRVGNLVGLARSTKRRRSRVVWLCFPDVGVVLAVVANAESVVLDLGVAMGRVRPKPDLVAAKRNPVHVLHAFLVRGSLRGQPRHANTIQG